MDYKTFEELTNLMNNIRSEQALLQQWKDLLQNLKKLKSGESDYFAQLVVNLGFPHNIRIQIDKEDLEIFASEMIDVLDESLNTMEHQFARIANPRDTIREFEDWKGKTKRDYIRWATEVNVTDFNVVGWTDGQIFIDYLNNKDEFENWLNAEVAP